MEKNQYLIFVLPILVSAFAVVSIVTSACAPALAQNITTGTDVPSNYSFIEKWGSFGTGPGQFNRPHDIAFDSVGNVYVSDRDNNRIQKFTHNGTFIKTWGSKGDNNGQFSIPYSIAIDDLDNIYVADRENSRIQKFDTNGTFLAKYGSDGKLDGQFHRPEGVTIDSEGNMYVIDRGNHRIQVFAPMDNAIVNMK
jgi:uncharacterized protein YjiK